MGPVSIQITQNGFVEEPCGLVGSDKLLLVNAAMRS